MKPTNKKNYREKVPENPTQKLTENITSQKI